MGKNMENLWDIYGLWNMYENIWKTGWWLEHEFYFSIQLGISSSQLTNSIIFQRGRYTTNQRKLAYIFFGEKGYRLIAPPRHLQEIDVDFR